MVATLLLGLLAAADVDPEPPARKIATANWYEMRFAPASQSRHRVMRSAAELVEALPQLRDRSATPRAVQKTATDEAARVLGVKSIDWQRQMLLVVAAGTQLP